MKNIPLTLALKYIFSKREIKYINFINLLSLTGISIGIAALICVTSLFNGLHKFTELQLFESDPHIIINAKQGEWFKYGDIYDKLKNYNSFPIIRRKVLLQFKEKFQPLELISQSPSKNNSLQAIENHLLIGKIDYQNKNLIYIPLSLAEKLRIRLGDTISTVSPKALEQFINSFQIQQGMSFVVGGIFQMNNKSFDFNTSYVINDSLSWLFEKQNSVNEVWIKLNSIDDIDLNKSLIQQNIPEYKISTFFDINKQFLSILKLESWLSFSIFFLIIVISAFNIIASITLTIFEKERDIAVLTSLGLAQNEISKIFSLIGLLIGSISNLIGFSLGIGLCLLQINFKFIKFDGNMFIIDYLPLEFNSLELILILVLSLLLTFISSIIPLKKIRKINITNSLKNE